MLVAKLPRLKLVDGCIIETRERRNCEIFFLTRFYAPPHLPEHEADVERLCAVYGAPETASTISIASATCEFTLIYETRQVRRRLPLQLTIKRLVTLAARIFGFEASRVRVAVQIDDDSYETLRSNSSAVLRAFEPQPLTRIEFEISDE